MESLSTLFPTDNLYKFLSISGLVIFGFCFVYPDIKLAELNQKVISIERDSTILEYQGEEMDSTISKLNSRVAEINREGDLREYLLKKYYSKSTNVSDTVKMIKRIADERKTYSLLRDKNEREYFEFKKKYHQELIPLNREANELRNMFDKNGKIAEEIDLKNISQYYNQLQLSAERNRIERITTYSVFGQIIGVLMSLSGFIFWYVLYQRPQDKIIKYQLNEYSEKFKKDVHKIITK